MTWNHRVMKRKTDDGDWFTIHEVYYDMDRSDKLSWTESEIAPAGHSIDDLRIELELMLACLEKPVLDWDADEIVEAPE